MYNMFVLCSAVAVYIHIHICNKHEAVYFWALAFAVGATYTFSPLESLDVVIGVIPKQCQKRAWIEVLVLFI